MPVKIRLTAEAGGLVVEVAGHQAKRLVDGGLAHYLADDLRKVVEPVLEIADASEAGEAPETREATPAPRKRKTAGKRQSKPAAKKGKKR